MSVNVMDVCVCVGKCNLIQSLSSVGRTFWKYSMYSVNREIIIMLVFKSMICVYEFL